MARVGAEFAPPVLDPEYPYTPSGPISQPGQVKAGYPNPILIFFSLSRLT
jgi:hypothetical protein